MEHLVDQENRLGGRVASSRPGKSAIEVANTGANTRSVLGEIQNVGGGSRRQSSRTIKPQGTNFSIYCDESVSVAAGSSKAVGGQTRSGAVALSRSTTTVSTFSNKENVLPKEAKVSVRTVRAALSSIPSHVHEVEEPMNTSVNDGESPMVVEPPPVVQHQQSCSEEQWRVPPIQDNHTVDIFSFPEYTQDIYRYLRDSEAKLLPKYNYMAKQTDITHSMRSILVDWLVEVGEEYKLQTETLHLAVNYIDRFLSYMAVQRAKLQLVGAACMFIAAKYEEIYPPDVGEFVYITDDTYNKRQVLRMEHLVLKVLNFDLSVPTTHLFVHKILDMAREEEQITNKLNALASYLSELALVDGQSFLKHCPSHVAASCVVLARLTLDLPAWPQQMALKSGYTLDELKECIVSLHNTFSKAETSAQQAVRDKYKSSKFYSVSELSPPVLY